jgi:hypothetical protein
MTGVLAGQPVLCNVSLEQLRHAADGTEIVCVQSLFHLAAEHVALDDQALRELAGVGVRPS